ncbi:DNA adenine methylase [Subtercola sp. YIM 133946]|uniref:DNA adenine methylase n=1 Tax=Subtercola sp. YIM 133946 TaxID=3118909 RepID=UPI002F93D778
MIAPPYLYGSGRRRPPALLAQAVPARFGSYIEPFLGSGARAIAVMQQHPGASFVLNSSNPDLLAVWDALLTDPGRLIGLVAGLAAGHDRRQFDGQRLAGLREQQPLPAMDRAARFVYLSGTAEGNGLAGAADDFASARFARDTVAFDAANLRALGRLLAGRDVRLSGRQPFDLLPQIHEDDIVFVDPPYPVAAAGEPGQAGQPRVPGEPRPPGEPLGSAAAPPPGEPRGSAAPRGAAPTPREVKSFVAAVTAKGAAVLLAGHPVDETPAGASGWSTLSRLPTDDGAPLWANSLLHRALRA